MNRNSLRHYCLSKKGATEDLPFDKDTLVIKVTSKIFALLPNEGDIPRINLKCDPALALELRQKYPAITPGYHMNKQHWNTVQIDGSIPENEIVEMIDHSYRLVVKSLTKSQREWIESL
ncbi:MAG: MmcQ/YjbR family DNA-binding protein [Chloroflexota bacterium]|nr:MmcQ/YjbR family DNA-binding protein [Chloroflexota bacterium]